MLPFRSNKFFEKKYGNELLEDKLTTNTK